MTMTADDLQNTDQIYDLAIVGGGINGAGIAADAARRGLRVFVCEQADFASATSSASSKLVHGGLRYLEYYEFRLVREALAEREVLLGIAPHLVRPMRFVMPHAPHLRPGWMIRAGLFLYDHLGKRQTLGASRGLRFTDDPALGGLLRDSFRHGYEYADCTVDDARLVIANLLAAHERGATILNHARCEQARVEAGRWQLEIGGEHRRTVTARALVNAAGPWAQSFLESGLRQKSPYRVRLVQGSHIVVPRLHEDPRALILQNADRRVVFVIPWLDFTLIGTTDRGFDGDPAQVTISEEETDYLLDVANRHFRRQLTRADIRHRFSGVRPLCDDESGDPAAVTRDYTLALSTAAGAPLLTVFGGKLTTYRRLALAALDELAPHFPALPASRTHLDPLPGGDLKGRSPEILVRELVVAHPFLAPTHARRLAGAYGSRALELLGDARTTGDLGHCFGHDLYEREVRFLCETEWARSAEDILWRRTRLGLYLDQAQRQALAVYLSGRPNRRQAMHIAA